MQYGTSKHLESLREMSHFKFFLKLQNLGHLCYLKLKFAIWYIKSLYMKCYFSSFCTKVKKLGTSVLSWTQICNMVHQNSLKIYIKCHTSRFPKKSYKIGIICVVMNSNLPYGASKHLESLRKILHFKFSWKNKQNSRRN